MISVIELNNECDKLLDIASEVERIDVYTKVKKIKLLRSAMNNAYDSDSYNEEVVASYKRDLNSALIELEDILCDFNTELKERHDERVKIFVLRKWYADRVQHAIVSKQEDKLLEFFMYMAYVNKCYNVTRDIAYSNNDSIFDNLALCEKYCKSEQGGLNEQH